MSAISRIALRAWYVLRLHRERTQPHPLGPAVIRSGDPRADRVLVIGNGFAHGWGVDSPREALAGRLSDAVADRTARGCDVDVIGAEVMDARSALAWVGDRELGGFDAVVVALGVNDALRRTPLADWERGLGELLSALISRVRPDAAVLVVGIPPLRALPAFGGSVARSAERHRDRLDAATTWTAELHGVARVGVPQFATDPRGRVSPASVYAQLGSLIAAELAPALVASRPDPEPRQPQPEREWAWSGTAEVLALAESGGAPELRRIADLARSEFTVEVAAVGLVEGDRLYYANDTDVLSGSVPLELSLCRLAISCEAPVVVHDTRRDDRAANPLVDVSGVRFYAGYPLRASDGRLIGVFSLQGLRPRRREQVRVDRVRAYAEQAEAVLRSFERPASPPAAHLPEKRPGAPRRAPGRTAPTRPVPLP